MRGVLLGKELIVSKDLSVTLLMPRISLTDSREISITERINIHEAHRHQEVCKYSEVPKSQPDIVRA